MIRISHGVQFVIDGDCVLAKFKGSLSRLAGPDVRQILIPLLPYLEQGIDFEQDFPLKNLENQKVQKVLEQLLEAGYLSFCNQSKVKSECNINRENHNYHLTLGVLGSDRLYKELVTTFASCNFDWEVIKIDSLQCEYLHKCSIVVFVNRDISDASTLTLAKLMCDLNIRFINVSVNDNEIQIGPFVERGTACLHCYSARRLSNLTFAYEARLFSVADKIYSFKEKYEISESEAKFISGIIEKQCAMIVKTEGLFQSPLQERIISFNLSTLQVTSEEFFRNPRCEICRSQELSEVKQWSINPFLKEERK